MVRIRPEKFRAQNPRDVAAQPVAVLIAHEWPVAVAVSGNEGVKFARFRPIRRQLDVFGADGLGVHRNEFVRTTQRGHFRAQVRQNFHQDIAADGGVLINPHAQTAQGVRRKIIQVAHGVIFAGFGRNLSRCGICPHEISVRTEQRVVQFDHLAAHPVLIGLQHFAGALVELDTVAVVGNVAAGDHDRREVPLEPEQRDGRRRDFPAVDGAVTQVIRRAAHRFYHAAGARPEIAADGHAAAGLREFADGHKVLQKTFGVGVTDEIRHRRRQPARAAGTERHAAPLHEIMNENFHQFQKSQAARQPAVGWFHPCS